MSSRRRSNLGLSKLPLDQVLKINDPVTKVWVAYLVSGSKSGKKPKYLQRAPCVDFFRGFNIDPVEMSAVLALREQIETNPEAELPNVLKMNVEPSLSYIGFCEFVSQNQHNLKKWKKILDEAFPYIMRAFICMTYQIRQLLPQALCNDKEGTQALRSLKNIGTVIWALMNADTGNRSDVVTLFRYFHESWPGYVEPALGPSAPSVIKSVLPDICCEAILFCNGAPDDSNDVLPFYEFVAMVLMTAVSYNLFTQDYFTLMLTFMQMIAHHSSVFERITDNAYMFIFAFVRMILETVAGDNRRRDDAWYQLGQLAIDMIPLLMPVRRKLDPQNPLSVKTTGCELAKAFIDMIVWVEKVWCNGKIKVTDYESLMMQSLSRSIQSQSDILDEGPNIELETQEAQEEVLSTEEFQKESTFFNESKAYQVFLKLIHGLEIRGLEFMEYLCLVFEEMQEKYDNSTVRGFLVSAIMTLDELEFYVCMIPNKCVLTLISPRAFAASVIRSNNDVVVETTRITVMMLARILEAEFIQRHDVSVLMESIVHVLKSHDATVVGQFVKWLRILLQNRFLQVSAVLANEAFIDELIVTEHLFFKAIQRHPTRSVVYARIQIFMFYNTFLPSTIHSDIVFCNPVRVRYLSSLFYDSCWRKHVLEWYQIALQAIQSPFYMIDSMCFMIKNLEMRVAQVDHMALCSMLVSVLFEAVKNNVQVAKCFVDCNMLETLLHFIEMFQSPGGDEVFHSIGLFYEPSDTSDVVRDLISLFYHATKNDQAFKRVFNDPTRKVAVRLTRIVKRVEMAREWYNLLMSFAFDKKITEGVDFTDCTIINSAALALLGYCVLRTTFASEYVEVVSVVTKESPVNMYECSRAEVLKILLEFIQDVGIEESLLACKAFVLIGSNFFCKNDVIHAVRALERSQKPACTLLMGLFTSVMVDRDKSVPLSFFHINPGGEDYFLLDSLVCEIPFSVELYMHFEDISQDSVILRLANGPQWLEVRVNTNRAVSLHLQNGTVQINNGIDGALPKYEWRKLKLTVNVEAVLLSYGAIQGSLSIGNRMDISSFNRLELSRCKCDFENIVITRLRDCQQITCYSAKLTWENSCYNMMSLQSNAAKFTCTAVPYSPSMLESTRNCGGPRIFLPLIKAADKSFSPKQYLVSWFTFMTELVRKAEHTFYGQHFFRSLCELLKDLPDDCFSTSTTSAFLLFFDTFVDENLKSSFLTHALSDILLVMRFPGLISTYMERPELMKNMSFDECLIQCCQTAIVDLDGVVSVLEKIVPESVPKVTSKFLIKRILSFSSDQHQELCFRIVLYLVSSRNPGFLASLEKMKYLPPFISLLSAISETTQIWSLRIIVRLMRVLPRSVSRNVTELILESLSIVHFSSNMDSVLLHLMMFISDQHPSEGTEEAAASMSIDEKRIVEFPQFIPLVVSLFNYSSVHYGLAVRNAFWNTFARDYQKLVLVSDWVIYVAFFATLDGTFNRWQLLFITFMQLEPGRFGEIQSAIVIACSLNGWDLQEVMASLLAGYLQQTKDVPTGLIEWAFFVLLSNSSVSKQQKSTLSMLSFMKDLTEWTASSYQLNPLWQPGALKGWNNMHYLEFLWHRFQYLLEQLYTGEVVENLLPLAYAMPLMIVVATEIDQTVANSMLKAFMGCVARLTPNSSFITAVNVLYAGFVKNPAAEPALRDWVQSVGFQKDALNSICKKLGEMVVRKCQELQTSIHQFKLCVESCVTKITAPENDYDEGSFVSARLQEKLRVITERASAQSEYNRKVWQEVMQAMESETMGVWSIEKPQESHRRVDRVLSRDGRILFSKRNRRFNPHTDASRRSAEPNAPEPPTVRRISFSRQRKITGLETIKMSVECQRIKIRAILCGNLLILETSMMFLATSECSQFKEEIVPVQKWMEIPFDQIASVLWRRYQHEKRALEFFTVSGKSFLFNFDSEETKLSLLDHLSSIKPPLPLVQTEDIMGSSELKKTTEAWKTGRMTNYEYLFRLNVLSGRSYNDLSQYPVFPWILTRFSDESIDFNDESVFRDLSLPIGALVPERLARLKALKDDMAGTSFYFLYRSFYSCPAFVVNYMIREEPFTSLHIDLQRDKFDDPDRLFHSTAATWNSVSGSDMDFRELIPEFFSCPDFLLNHNGFGLGTTRAGARVGDVVLPPWAVNAVQFVTMNRLALESPYVSAHLNEWIDLIWGFKQRGPEAGKASNDFHPFSYSSSILERSAEEDAIREYAMNMGIVAEQLFTAPHPKRAIIPERSLATVMFQAETTRLDLPVSTVCAVYCDPKYLYVADGTGSMAMFKLRNSWEPMTKTFGFGPLGNKITEKLSTVDMMEHIAVVSAKWLDIFEVHDLETKKVTFRSHPATACISCLAYDGEGVVICGLIDSVVTIWHTASQLREPVYIIGHNSYIIDVAISKLLRLTASVDDSRKIIVAHLQDRGVVFTKQLIEMPQQIIISDLGFVCVTMTKVTHEGQSSLLQLMSMRGEVLAQLSFPRKISFTAKFTSEDCTDFLAVCIDTEIIIIRVHDMSRICEIDLESRVTSVAYSRRLFTLFARTASGELYASRFIV